MPPYDPDPESRDERLDRVIAGFLEEVEANPATDRRQWLARHPEFFDELSDFFADRDEVEKLAAPLRDAARSADDRALALDWLEPSAIPDHLGRIAQYEVVDWVGAGGMGVVFKGHDPALNRYVAIKVLAPQWSADSAARRRFTREAQAAAAISHPHVITIHAVGEWQGRPFLVMEFVTGGSLQQRIDDGPIELKELLRIGVQVASGLAAAHAQGLIHRDIKPANIMLENELARVKITDFGLARAVDDTRLTQHGTLAGTPAYMAPEQARGEPMDRRSDLFSLGSVLYAMATGRAAFCGESSVEVLRRVSDGHPPPVRALNPEAPDWLAEIIERLHAKDPADRFQAADEVADLLERHLARLQDPSRPVVEHPWVRRPSRAAAWGRRAARRLGAPRLAVPALLLAVAVGSAAWTRWALQAPAPVRGLSPPRSERLKTAWEYHCDFRNGRYDHRWLHLEPNGPLATLVKADPRGLRIAIPPDTRCRAVGAFTLFGVHGDFEVTAAFEVLKAQRPREEVNVGFELDLRTVGGGSSYLTMGRMQRASDAAPQLLIAWGEQVDGKNRPHSNREPTELKAGRFRVARVGSMVHYLVAAQGSDAFRQIGSHEFGTTDLSLVRLMARVNESRAPLDVLWTDLTIRAESLPGWTDGKPAVPPGRSSWLLLGGLAGVAALGIGIWWSGSRQARAAVTKARAR